MKIAFSKDFGKTVFSFDEDNWEEDSVKCQKIKKLIESIEWITLCQVFVEMEQKYLDIVTSVKPQEQSFREGAIYAARMSGFLQAVGAAKKIVDAYNEFIEKRKDYINSIIDENLKLPGKEEDINVAD